MEPPFTNRIVVRERAGAARRARVRSRREATTLAAAERVIGRRGFHDAGMTDIAREARCAIGTLYAFFESKEALYERLLVTRAEELAATVRAALAGAGDARERLEAVFRARLEFFRAHRAFVRIYATMVPVASGAAWGLPPRVVKLREAITRAVAEVVAEAERAGELRTDASALDIALAFQAITQSFLIDAVRGRSAFPEARVTDAVRAVFFDPIFGPRRAAPRRVR
jgi:AcrR family transcriptional regulator